MATITLTKCDECGREKKDADIWYLMTVADGSTIELGNPIIEQINNAANLIAHFTTLDLCSHACLHKKIDEVLNLKRPGRPRGSKNRKAKAEEKAA